MSCKEKQWGIQKKSFTAHFLWSNQNGVCLYGVMLNFFSAIWWSDLALIFQLAKIRRNIRFRPHFLGLSENRVPQTHMSFLSFFLWTCPLFQQNQWYCFFLFQRLCCPLLAMILCHDVFSPFIYSVPELLNELEDLRLSTPTRNPQPGGKKRTPGGFRKIGGTPSSHPF